MKKGFTLIELLAVILILGIIALIAIPQVSDVIDDVKKSAIKTSAQNIKKSSEDVCVLEQMRNDTHTSKYTIEDGVASKDLNVKNLPKSGEVDVSYACEANVAVASEDYCAIIVGENIIVNSNINNCSLESLIEDTPEACFVFDSETHTITDYDYTNSDCPKRIKIPATISNTPVEYIADEAFITVPSYDEFHGKVAYLNDLDSLNLLTLESSFYNETAYTFYQITDLNTYSNPDELEYNYYSSSDTYYINPIPRIGYGITGIDFSSATNLKSIGNYAFENNLITIAIFGNNPNLEYIGSGAFNNNLISGVLDFSNTKLNKIGRRAFDSNSITNVKFPNTPVYLSWLSFANNDISIMPIPNNKVFDDHAYGGNPITSIVMPNTLEYYLSWGWEWNSSLTNIQFSNRLKMITYGAFSNSGVTSVTLPDSLVYLGAEAFDNYNGNIENLYLGRITKIPYSCFRGFSGSSLVIPNTVTDIDRYAFSGNSNKLYNDTAPAINELVIPDSVVNIEEGAFQYLKVNNLILGNGVTKVESNAFYGRVKNVTLGSNIETIGSQAFYYYPPNDTIAQALVIPNKVKTIGSLAFYGRTYTGVTIPYSVEKILEQMYTCTDASTCGHTISIDRNEGTIYTTDDTLGNPYATIVWSNTHNDYVENGNKFKNGQIIYFNPVTGTKCSASTSNSDYGTITGCMRWYAFNDNPSSSTIDLLLDHSITNNVKWYTSQTTVNGPSSTFLNSLKTNTDGWTGVPSRTDSYTVNNGVSNYTVDFTGYKARILTIEDIEQILDCYDFSTSFEHVNSNNSLGDAVYFDTLTYISPYYSSNYGWLYDNLKNSSSYWGRNAGTYSRSRYWVLSPYSNFSTHVWVVNNNGSMSKYGPQDTSTETRPVITVNKSVLIN